MEKNKIYQMDCIEGMKQIPDESVDLIITDPPYSTPTITSFGREKIRNVADLSIQETYVKTLKEQYSRVLKPDAPLFMFCDDGYYASIFRAFYDWNNLQMLVWDKGRIGMGKPFRKRHELLFYANRKTMDYNRTEGITHYPTVLNYKPVGKEKVHGAQKPIELVKDLIKGFSNEGDTVLDTFMGSGTTAIAAMRSKRNYIGFELQPYFAQIANDRIEKERDLIESGDLFELD